MMHSLVQQSQTHYLDVADLQAIFRVGRSKARLIMDALPSVRIGKKDYVLETKLNEYIEEHKGIDVDWPHRRRR